MQEGNHNQLIGEEGIYLQLCEIQGTIQQQIARDVSLLDTSQEQVVNP